MKPAVRLPLILNHKRRSLFAVLVANGVLQAVTLIAIAVLTRYGFDASTVVGHDARQLRIVIWGLGGLIFLGVCLLVLRTAERTTAERLGQSYLTETRLLLFDHLNRVPTRALQHRSRGVLMVRFVADLNALNGWVSRGLSRLIVAAISALAALSALAWISRPIAATVLCALVIAGLVVLATGPKLYLCVRDVRRARGRLAANLGEKLIPFSPVRVFGRTRGEGVRLSKQSESLSDAAVARSRLAAFVRSTPDALLPMVTALVILVSLMQIEPMSVGSLLAALLIVNLIASPLRDLMQIFVFWQDFRAARDVLAGFLALPTLGPDGSPPRLKKGPGGLTFVSVDVLGSIHSLTAKVEPRTLVVIAGVSGSGKSTVLGLAARLFDPDKGSVYMDGQLLSELDVTSIRTAVSMVTPDLPLMRGTIRRNLTYRARKSNNDEITEVLELCGLTDRVHNLPLGLETRLTESGGNLPVGFRHRLLFARAMMGGPRYLLIDDADALASDEVVKEIIQKIARSRATTMMIVSSDPILHHQADAIWTMEGGRLTSVIPSQFVSKCADNTSYLSKRVNE